MTIADASFNVVGRGRGYGVSIRSAI